MNTPIPAGTKLPLIGTYRDTVGGNGFLAQVELRVRLLGVVDADCETWIYASRPSGWAECGKDLFDAHAAFRQSLTAMLFDLSAEARTYEEFRAAVEMFATHRSPVLEDSWQQAVKQIDLNLAAQLGLKVASAGLEPYAVIVEVPLKTVTTEINQLDDSARPKLAKAA